MRAYAPKEAPIQRILQTADAALSLLAFTCQFTCFTSTKAQLLTPEELSCCQTANATAREPTDDECRRD